MSYKQALKDLQSYSDEIFSLRAALAEAERERDRMTAACDCGKVSGLCQSPNECRAAITKIIMTRAERAEASLFKAERRIAEQSERIHELYRAQKNQILSAKSAEYDTGELLIRTERAEANLSAARAVIEDGVDTLESMNLHIDNPLYDRLLAFLERTATADAIK